ncbi:MAG: Fic family protein [Campylobacterota bacterium]|nr:Fic family protein [Campylobacterota bacterium]
MSKYQLDSSPIYIDGTDIPKNKLDITDSELIHEIELNLLTEAYEQFSSQLNKQTIFDETYFIDLHKKTFESLYDFAGVYRNVNMSKGESQFCLASYLQNESTRIFNELKDDNYLSQIVDKSVFANKLAYYQGELISLHPFYELNGRILRLFFDMLCIYNGYNTIDYTDAIADGKYIEASIECVQYADTSKLENIIFNGLEKR